MITLENVKTLNTLEQKMIKKYGYGYYTYMKTNNGLQDAIAKVMNRGKRPTSAPVEVLRYRSDTKRNSLVLQKLRNELLREAPKLTHYGEQNMIRVMDETNGVMQLGTFAVKNGQKVGAPYMVHINSPTNKHNHGHAFWIERSIGVSQYYANNLRKEITEPEYDFGTCLISVIDEGGEYNG